MDPARVELAYQTVRGRLLRERNAAGHWEGELASSALSTATAISALSVAGPSRSAAERESGAPRAAGRDGPVDSAADAAADAALIARGLTWLANGQNADGGWGDTDRSYSNIATTMLVRAAAHLAGAAAADGWPERLGRAETWIERRGSVAGLRQRYGRDKTFAVPILSNCAIAGLNSWKDVSPLPFELACFPQSLYRFLQMPVVSYAIPALVAIGQARHHRAPSRWPWMRAIRGAAVGPSLRVLRRMQPESGGYLEATPLTSFVVMNLAASGRGEHAVAESGLRFLRESARRDGSWPIDTNLATWNTTLALNALAGAGEDLPTAVDCLPWLLKCQHRRRHPFTGAEAGGWGWSDLSGAVPDSDDTPGALLALDAWRRSPKCTSEHRAAIEEAAGPGLSWLIRLQNRDGGWPTFCRGWGKLPFDRSGADLTAHALRALEAWKDHAAIRGKTEATRARGWRYLTRTQRADGSWIPLWFGNQDETNEENPVYGTAKVLLAFRDAGRESDAGARRALGWLRERQNSDGGWGGGPAQTAGVAHWPTETPAGAPRERARPAAGSADAAAAAGASQSAGSSTVEETALAVEALLGGATAAPLDPRLERGVEWLCRRAIDLVDKPLESAPIGFYFAKLWYYERLYPLMFTAAALGRVRRRIATVDSPAPPALHTA